MKVKNFSELRDGDIVKLSLEGLFEVSQANTVDSFTSLKSLDGHMDWYFGPEEDEEDWNISVVGNTVDK